MRSLSTTILLALPFISHSHPLDAGYNLRPFELELNATRMYDLIGETRLPKQAEYPGLGAKAGIDLGVLKSLKDQWSTTFDWDAEQRALNKFNHFTATIEGLTIHFIHETSSDPFAIPLLANHGWPGSFLEFLPVIKSLTQQATTKTGKSVSFNMVVPSLPGFAFSSTPPENWTVHDTARVFHTLMINVLGYQEFAVHGTDWGAAPAYSLYDRYNATVRAAHFDFLPFYPKFADELAAMNISLSPLEQLEAINAAAWRNTGNGYFVEQTTKPNELGLALYDSPIGQLSWIGSKMVEWSDPRAGTAPSVLTHTEILRSVSLYYLTETFVSSVFIYYQNSLTGFATNYTKAHTDAPLLFSSFAYNVGFWHRTLVQQVGNLVYYANHDFGGHFAGLDNPPALIEDLREIGTYWEN